MSLSKVSIQGRAAQSVRQGYPWVFSNQIQSWDLRPQTGELVEVLDPKAHTLGFAYANPHTTLALRMLYSPAAAQRGTNGLPDERVELFRKLDRAWSRRQTLALPTNAYRLVWSEADGLPGLVCDRFGDRWVVQCLTAGMEARKPLILEWLVSHLKPRGIFERSEGIGRSREGLLPVRQWLYPQHPEPELLEPVAIQEGALRFWVDVGGGRKPVFIWISARPAVTCRPGSFRGRFWIVFLIPEVSPCRPCWRALPGPWPWTARRTPWKPCGAMPNSMACPAECKLSAPKFLIF